MLGVTGDIAWPLIKPLAGALPVAGRWIAESLRYGIRINEPPEHARTLEPGQIVIGGHYKIKPPDDSLQLIVASLPEGLYWPQWRPDVQFDDLRKTWTARVWMGPGARSQFVLAVVVGKHGRLMYDYFHDVGNNVKDGGEHWHPLRRLSHDSLVCDQIMVNIAR